MRLRINVHRLGCYNFDFVNFSALNSRHRYKALCHDKMQSSCLNRYFLLLITLHCSFGQGRSLSYRWSWFRGCLFADEAYNRTLLQFNQSFCSAEHQLQVSMQVEIHAFWTNHSQCIFGYINASITVPLEEPVLFRSKSAPAGQNHLVGTRTELTRIEGLDRNLRPLALSCSVRLTLLFNSSVSCFSRAIHTPFLDHHFVVSVAFVTRIRK